ncbi:hypothetical protein H7992_09520 [Sporosarcina sp. resist]|uniref:hypothetical protein n=1 Tax=Sporosarcina sp. resist TaxID=2762563 RepID=UPI00164E9F4D|nr:hypothetical protein [Sporosarcina sp. resist]QNK89857.1 hypothetical protein H7992_09520 [Sporosarcina sp. resist]
MNKEQYLKNDEVQANEEVSIAAKETTVSASVSYKVGLVGYATSSRIDAPDGILRVVAKNTGSNTLVVRVIRGTGVAIVKEWSVAPGKTITTGDFSLPPDYYSLRLARERDSYPTSGTGTITSVQYYG